MVDAGVGSRDQSTGPSTKTRPKPRPDSVFVKQQWQPGQSGNPSGREKKIPELSKKCKKLTNKTLVVIESILLDPAARDSDRLRAAEMILAYGHGKPRQSLEIDARIESNVLHLMAVQDLSAPALESDFIDGDVTPGPDDMRFMFHRAGDG
jgi:hypothetical protein